MRTWHILDVGSIWMKEFASALSQNEHVVAWAPKIENLGMFQRWHREKSLSDPPLQEQVFPLQRGYARAPLRWMAGYESGLLRTMLTQTPLPEKAPLICSTPFYAPVAERWPGPVVYYLTDMAVAYPSLNARQVKRLDRSMCRVARAVCPNSRRIAEYLIEEAGCEAEKITIVPNATRASNVAAKPLYAPGPCPEDVQDLPRPLVGVVGDLSGNLDWELIADAMKRTPAMSWLFVGPANKRIEDRAQNTAREWVKQHARFVGFKPYGLLQEYARCLDVAVLPYKKKEPTFSGSSTRFYEHLAAGRPMLATRGFAELLGKEPLLKLVGTGLEMATALSELEELDFCDGLEAMRWQASLKGTWEERATTIRQLLVPRYLSEEVTSESEAELLTRKSELI